ncbi:MAG: HEAT repeat domain-containing protein [Planctomycetales bacterium]|nr:HEAT repeat domain-containing protein [Planctomycetales bacterium]
MPGAGACAACGARIASPARAEATSALIALLRLGPPAADGQPAEPVAPGRRPRRLLPVVRRAPSWVLSAAAHAALLLLLAQLVVMIREADPLHAVRVSLGAPRAREEPGERTPDREDEPSPAKAETRSEAEATDPGRVPDAPPPPVPVADPPPEPSLPTAAPAGASPTPPAPPPRPSPFAARTGPGRAEALTRHGGSAETEQAVDRGLAWLAAHQSEDGRWSSGRFSKGCPVEDDGAGKIQCACWGEGVHGHDVAYTGLAVLCFLGAGHAPGEGPYTREVTAGLAFLLASQQPDGAVGDPNTGYPMYNHGIGSLAICEAAALTRDPRFLRAAELAVQYTLRCQQVGGGWDYYGWANAGRNDVSVSGWQVMALKSALIAGIPVPERHWAAASKFLRRMTRSDGEVRYADRGFQGSEGNVRHGPGMTAVGLLCRLYLGEKPGDAALAASARRIAAETPSWHRSTESKLHTVYYWYYGTLALFQWGGEPWADWNRELKSALIPNQRKDGHAAGSWDPAESWLSRFGGRLYATTLNILNLEVYYRYLPIYRDLGVEPTPDPTLIRTPEQALASVTADSSGTRFAAVQMLAATEGGEAFKALEKSLGDPNSMVRWQAVKGLAKRTEPRALDLLVEALRAEKGLLRRVLVDALGERGDRRAVPALLEALADEDSEVRRRAVRALEKLSGESLGAETAKWTAWWREAPRARR